MFNFIFSNYKLNNSNYWLYALAEREDKKQITRSYAQNKSLTVQKEQSLSINKSMITNAHTINSISGIESEEQKIGDIYSELDTIPLPLPLFNLAF